MIIEKYIAQNKNPEGLPAAGRDDIIINNQ